MTTTVAHALEGALHRYLAARRQAIPKEWADIVRVENCRQIQRRHFFLDLFLNPLNTLWAIPYLTYKKFLEGAEKLGVDVPEAATSLVPKSFKTGFQREMERTLQTRLFALSGRGHPESALERELEKDEVIRAAIPKHELQVLAHQAEGDIRKAVADFCAVHNGFTDLAASVGMLWVGRKFFRDGSLDVFGFGRRIAAGWAREDAVKTFFLGEDVGDFWYGLAGAPEPSRKQRLIATALSMLMLAIFATVVNVLSYPVQNQLGFKKKQLDRLLRSVEDKVLLRFTKAARQYAALPSSRIQAVSPEPTSLSLT